MAEIEAKLLPVIEFDVWIDDRLSHPLSRHRIQVTTHTCIISIFDEIPLLREFVYQILHVGLGGVIGKAS